VAAPRNRDAGSGSGMGWLGAAWCWRRRRVGSGVGAEAGALAMCLVGAAAEPGRRMGSAEWVGVGGRDCLGLRWGIMHTQKPGSGSAGKQANGVSKALLRRVNRERGEMAYRACGETAEEPPGSSP
jgi:hypothetical protein